MPSILTMNCWNVSFLDSGIATADWGKRWIVSASFFRGFYVFSSMLFMFLFHVFSQHVWGGKCSISMYLTVSFPGLFATSSNPFLSTLISEDGGIIADPPEKKNVGNTIMTPPICEWFIPTISGDLGDGLLLFYPHY